MSGCVLRGARYISNTLDFIDKRELDFTTRKFIHLIPYLKKVKNYKPMQINLKPLMVLCLFGLNYCCTPQKRLCIQTLSTCLESCHGNDICKDACRASYDDCTGYTYIFPIHICVVTNNGTASTLTVNDLRAEVDTLNKYFQAFDDALPDNRRKIIHFEFKSATLYNEASNASSALVDSLDQAVNFGQPRFSIEELIDSENNPLIRDPAAINIYIIDSWSSARQFDFRYSYGAYNQEHPYALIDYERLGHVDAAIEHEMGHCFGLSHYCLPGTTDLTDTNIMSTGGSFPTNGGCNNLGVSDKSLCTAEAVGRRNLGFDQCQVDLILERAPLILNALGL